MDNLLTLIDPDRRFTIHRGDRHGLRIERHYAADVAEVWDACTSPQRLSRWLGELRETPVEGGTAQLVMAGDQQEHVVAITVQRCDAPRRLLVTWHFPDEDETLLDLRLAPDGTGARLVLEHLAMPADDVVEYGGGWEGFITRLAAHLAGEPVPDSAAVEALTMPRWRAGVEALADRWPRLEPDGGIIELEREVPADPATVWRAITEPGTLSSWFGAFSGDRSAWTIEFDNGSALGCVRECEPDRRLVTTWRWDVEVAEGLLTVELQPAGEGTTVRLRHEGIPGPLAGMAAGWHAHLEVLVATLAGDHRAAQNWSAEFAVARAMLRGAQ